MLPSIPPAGLTRRPVLISFMDQFVDDTERFFMAFDSSPHLLLQFNRGILHNVYTNSSSWKDRLQKMGFKLPFAFGCVFRFLFR